jgi:hypothetical protein
VKGVVIIRIQRQEARFHLRVRPAHESTASGCPEVRS